MARGYMKQARVYLDTSVIGGCFDPEFSKWSNGLFKDFRLGHFHPVLSEVVAFEIERAPLKVREKYLELVESGAQVLRVDEAVVKLTALFLKEGIVGKQFEEDLTHIALATVNEVDILVSWNFKHIVHYDKIKVFNKVSINAGYKAVSIYSPREVANYEESI